MSTATTASKGATTSELSFGTQATNQKSTKTFGKIRVANLFDDNGKPGGAMDIYDTAHPTSSDKPIIKDLAYGKISDYVEPHGSDPYATSSNLWVFPAGSIKGSGAYNGTNIDNSGFEADDQVTVAIGPSTGSGSGLTLEMSDVIEAGPRLEQGTSTPPPTAPSGKALLVVRSANLGVEPIPSAYLTVDGKCPAETPWGTDTTTTDASQAMPTSLGSTQNYYFEIAPGTHELGVIGADSGTGISSCSGQTPVSTISADVGSGKAAVVLVYGTGDKKNLKLVSAPIS